MSFIFFFIGVFIYGVILLTYISTINPNGHIWFGVSLPSFAFKDERLHELQISAKKMYRKYALLSLLILLPIFLLSTYYSLMLIYMYLWTIGGIILLRIPYLKAHRAAVKLKRENEWSIGDTLKPTDADENWVDGMLYKNPNDKSIMVPKRLGIGSTINIGTKVGKRFYYGIFVFIGLVLIGTGWMAVQTDFSTPTLSKASNGVVSIKYPMYNYSFNMKEVQELKLVDSLPSKGVRTNGVATDTVAIGNFKFNEYGKSKAYLFKNTPPYIVIKLPELYVLFNREDPTETERIYAELKESKGADSQ